MPTIFKQRVTAQIAAKEALEREDGLTLFFDCDDYPSIEACRKAAQRFRMSFYTMRTRERRSSNFNYENLVCLIERQPNGWSVKLEAEASIVSVIGEPIRELLPEHQRWLALRQEATDCRGYVGVPALNIEAVPTQPCPFEEDDEAFFWSYDPEKARAVYEDLKWPLPAFVQ